jgi:di/tripeptidase
MKNLNLKRAKEIFSIPTISEREELIKDYLVQYAIEMGYNYKIDTYGNLYLIKGDLISKKKYPILVAHIDTVHVDQISLINNNQRLDIQESNGELRAINPITGNKTGIGGDDKAGVIIALEVLERIEKGICAFFVEEEIGALGSNNLNYPIMSKGAYAIQFDAPTGSEVCVHSDGVRLFDIDFMDLIYPTLSKFGYSNFVMHRPFTDVSRVRSIMKYNTLNLGAGYYNFHTKDEYVLISEMENAVNCTLEIIDVLSIATEKIKPLSLQN